MCDGCDQMIEEEAYIEHWEKCIKMKRRRFRICDYCGKNILSESDAIKNHESECEGKAQCEFCKDNYPLDLLEEH